MIIGGQVFKKKGTFKVLQPDVQEEVFAFQKAMQA